MSTHRNLFLLLLVFIFLVSCSSQNFESTETSSVTSIKLEDETWQLQGSGHSYQSATTIVADGSTVAYAFHYGLEAGEELAGTSKLYYNPTPNSEWKNGIRPATNNVKETSLESLSEYEPSSSGIKIVCDQMNMEDCSSSSAYYMTANQALPLKDKEIVRLFFEARDLSSKNPPTQIFSIDSVDGYTGEDFNSASSTVCGGSKSMDYAPAGDCELTLVIAANEETGLAQARQFKIGYPVLESWLWDEAPGTFMIITGADRCKKTNDGLFYAVWNGKTWEVMKDEKGCAQTLVPYAHGPVIVNLGEGLYKLYYEDIMSNTPLMKVTKPLRFITADATRSGDPTVVDFEDWDSFENAAEVDFLWPDGTTLTDEEESGLGDHFIFMPDGLDSQVMYLNLGGLDNSATPAPSAGIGIAIPIG